MSPRVITPLRFDRLGLAPLPDPAAPPLLMSTMVPCMVTPDRPDVDKTAGALQGHLSACFDDHFHPRLQVNLLTGVHGVVGADLLVAGAPHVSDQAPSTSWRCSPSTVECLSPPTTSV